MRLLLDTNALLWTMNGSKQLSRKAKSAIQNLGNEALVSAGSIWEAAVKHRSGKLPQAAALLNDPRAVLSRLSLNPLPIQMEHAKLAGLIADSPKEPFDRMRTAQALLQSLTPVGSHRVLDSMLVNRLR